VTVVRDQDEILDAYAEALWKVHARLDRDDIARRELASDAVAEARLLVDVEADAVARSAITRRAVSCTSWQSCPGRTRASAASCAASTVS
jgi:hypothetical protein